MINTDYYNNRNKENVCRVCKAHFHIGNKNIYIYIFITTCN